MKNFKNILISVFILTFSLSLFSQSVNLNNPEFQNMIFKAQTNRRLRVMITFSVPDLIKLTKDSMQYKTGTTPSNFLKQKAYNADLKLEDAIFKVADKILFNMNNTDYKVIRRYSTLPFLAISASPESLYILKDLPEVKSITEDILIHLPKPVKSTTDKTPDKPQLMESTKVVGADLAWSMGVTGKGWYVAILDTGIRKTHNMFKGKNIVEACYSAEGDCPNGTTQMIGDGAAAHFYDHSDVNGYDHGTHVSGIAAGNNHTAIFGIAKEANIIAVQVFSYFASENDVLSWSSDQIKGLEFVYQQRNNYNIASANLSIGGGSFNSFCDGVSANYKKAIDNLVNVGIATAIATGNDGYCNSISHPACISSGIAVGATKKADVEASFSNWRKGMVDIYAPGVNIYSSTGDNDSSFAGWNGTSMATPHVTGAWALLKQLDRKISVAKALKLLQDKGKIIHTNCSSGGSQSRFNIGESIQSLLVVAPPLNFSGEQKISNSLLQIEYLNKLTWDSNPFNSNKGKNITKYKIFLYDGTNLNLLSEVDGSTFEYLHRKLEKDKEYSYAIKAVTDSGEESIPSYIDVK